MGWDAFGCPLETRHPDKHASAKPGPNTSMNFSACCAASVRYDWAREIPLRAPYYRWISGFFCACSSAASPIAKRAGVNWCPKCCTVLASDKSVNGG